MALRLGANLILFLFVATPLSVYLSEFDRYPGLLGDKLAYFRQHHDRFDTLIVGSSYMHFGLDPRKLDEALREAGLESSSFNLAISGFMGHEIDESLRVALKADRNNSVKRVLVDFRPLQATPNPAHANTEHEVWWHSPHQTVAVLRTLWKGRAPLAGKLRVSIRHIKLLIENHLPLGTAFRLRQQRSEDRTEGWFWQTLQDRRGFEPILPDHTYNPSIEDQSNVVWAMVMQRDRMLSERETLSAERERIARQADQRANLEHVNVGFWRSQSSRLRSRGIVPLYVLMPSYRGGIAPLTNALAERGALIYYLSFNDPRRFPELFAIENRYEFGHLNQPGSSILSRRLGEEFGRFLKGEPSLVEPPLRAAP